ncbi:DUF3732 domain-containing protein [Brevibacillus borstelensis]|uniref:DUF3732 domain-containing protein n=1 Tax=Brevibacillus borstelensis TaxID=45462 RepID=UPI002E21526B|nr:DUF3732 domain-containing protein [Brevibacillus borstelensis]
MKFYIDQIILWLRNGNVRTLEFKPNKVNVITGDSSRGKTVIWSIIDYCLFASKANIPEEIVNENVEWYGIRFFINDKFFTIARKHLLPGEIVSDEYYFSGVGEVPEKPAKSIEDDEIKKFMDAEFGINPDLVVPYGGKKIRQGSKISLRYFLLFNSQDQNTITNSDTFFDKQTDLKNIEALQRIFDLAIGIDTPEQTLVREKLNELEQELKKVERKTIHFEKRRLTFHNDMQVLLNKAKEYQLISDNQSSIEDDISNLKKVVYELTEVAPSLEPNKYESLRKEKLEITKRIKKLKKFEKEYKEYKTVIENNMDSLKPIQYIYENYSELIKIEEIHTFIRQLNQELLTIKHAIKQKAPLQFDVSKRLKDLQKRLTEIDHQMQAQPAFYKTINNDVEKGILIGEIKTKFELFSEEEDQETTHESVNQLKNEIEQLRGKLGNREQRVTSIIRMLESIINTYLEQVGDALENYKGFKAAFDYKEKALFLQDPNSFHVSKVIGSSSNHMFLHLCLFLGLHESIIRQGVPFVPPFLFLDQPSRPYYDNNAKKATDKAKITIAMKLLNDFISKMNKECNAEFQFIVVEHIPKKIWENSNLQNFHLVETFLGDNKLIRDQDMLKTDDDK